MTERGSTRLGIRRLIVLGHRGQRVAASVFCPRQQHSVHVDECSHCPRAVGIDGASVTCVPDVERVDTEASVGAVLGAASVSVLAHVAVGDLADHARTGIWMAAVVLDPDHRPVGMVHREQLAGAQRHAFVAALARPLAPVLETSHLMSTVERMVHERARVLPVVDTALRVVGVVTDLDALRWVAAHHSRI